MANLQQETFKTWDKLADIYWEKFSAIQIYDESYDQFLTLLSHPNPNILDLCCGPGNIAHYLKTKQNSIHITGLDASPNMVAKAEVMVPSLVGIVMNMEDIGQLPNKYDGIICGFGIPFLPHEKVNKWLLDCHLLLNTKGIFYLSFEEGDPTTSGVKIGSTGDKTLFYVHRLEIIQLALQEVGFKDFLIWKLPYPTLENQTSTHAVILCRKTE
ncbi:MAG: class I SAM-dependent methyltransferase [Saprospiraceae bacterium]